MVVMTGLNSSSTTTFCSADGNFCVKSLALGFLCFLVTFVKPASKALLDVTVAQEAGADLAVVGARVKVLWS